MEHLLDKRSADGRSAGREEYLEDAMKCMRGKKETWATLRVGAVVDEQSERRSAPPTRNYGAWGTQRRRRQIPGALDFAFRFR